MTTETTESITADLQALTREQKTVGQMIAAIPELTKAVITATSNSLTGRGTVAQLQAAQQRLDAAQEALTRKNAIDIAIAETEQSLVYARSQERREFCDQLSREFISVRERYVVESRKLLTIFKEMHRLHNKSIAMNSHTLLTESDYKLDLPALRSPNDAEQFSVGSMVRSGSM